MSFILRTLLRRINDDDDDVLRAESAIYSALSCAVTQRGQATGFVHGIRHADIAHYNPIHCRRLRIPNPTLHSISAVNLRPSRQPSPSPDRNSSSSSSSSSDIKLLRPIRQHSAGNNAVSPSRTRYKFIVVTWRHYGWQSPAISRLQMALLLWSRTAKGH